MFSAFQNQHASVSFFRIALLAAALGWTNAAQADCLTLSVQLTAYQQDLVEEQVSSTLVKSTVQQIKITTQDILDLLAEYHGETFPTGSTICFESGGTVQIRDASGAWLLTVDDAVIPLGTGGEDIPIPTAMTLNLVSGRIALTQWFLGGFEFHWSPRLDFLVMGLSTAKTSATYPSVHAKASASAKVAGEGEFEGEDAVFAGTIGFKGTLPIEE